MLCRLEPDQRELRKQHFGFGEIGTAYSKIPVSFYFYISSNLFTEKLNLSCFSDGN